MKWDNGHSTPHCYTKTRDSFTVRGENLSNRESLLEIRMTDFKFDVILF